MHSTSVNEPSGDQDTIVDELNSLLRGELAAAETYRETINQFPHSVHSAEFAQCEASHQRRANLIRGEITRIGGTPSETSGAWGAFAKLVTRGADLMGETAAIAVLEQGEDIGLSDYRKDLNDLHLTTRRLIVLELAPEQVRTHQIISALKTSLN
jgi:hypothetical protein